MYITRPFCTGRWYDSLPGREPHSDATQFNEAVSDQFFEHHEPNFFDPLGLFSDTVFPDNDAHERTYAQVVQSGFVHAHAPTVCYMPRSPCMSTLCRPREEDRNVRARTAFTGNYWTRTCKHSTRQPRQTVIANKFSALEETTELIDLCTDNEDAVEVKPRPVQRKRKHPLPASRDPVDIDQLDSFLPHDAGTAQQMDSRSWRVNIIGSPIMSNITIEKEPLQDQDGYSMIDGPVS